MSGRKNHHVPQLLQRGFGVKRKKSVQVWVYGKDGSPFLTSTNNFGAERDFYIEGDDSLADDLITEFEGEMNCFLQALSNANPQAISDTSRIASVLAHLEMRTKFFRQEMLFFSNAFLEEIRRFLSKPQNRSRFLIENPDIVQNELLELGLSDEQKALVNTWLSVNLDQVLNDRFAELETQFHPLFETLVDQLGKSIKASHLKIMKKDMREIGRRRAYLKMSYRAIRFDEPSLILPDTMIAFLKRKGGITPFLDKTDEVQEVYLPLSSQTVLHGYRGDAENRELRTINRILASCASRNFVAHENQDQLNALTHRIGKNAKMISRPELRKVIRECIPIK